MKALFTITLLFIIVLLNGCLGSSSSSTAPTLAFLYFVGQGDNSIHAVDEKSTGDLQASAISTFATSPRPVSIALHPSRNFLYVPNLTSNTVSGFSIDHTTGVLTPIGTALPPTPVCASVSVCSNPIVAAVNSGGQFLFVLNQGSASPAVPASISVFSIDQTRGLLTAVSGSPFAFASLVAPNPQFMAVSPTQGFLYVSNGAAGNISAFAIGASGTLTELSGSPFSVGAGATAAGFAIDPKGQFLYAADSANNKIASFNVAGGPLARRWIISCRYSTCSCGRGCHFYIRLLCESCIERRLRIQVHFRRIDPGCRLALCCAAQWFHRNAAAHIPDRGCFQLVSLCSEFRFFHDFGFWHQVVRWNVGADHKFPLLPGY